LNLGIIVVQVLQVLPVEVRGDLPGRVPVVEIIVGARPPPLLGAEIVGMLRRGVVGYEVHDDPQPAGVGCADQLPQILLCPERVPEREMIRYGIAEVALLGARDRREPQNAGTQILDGIEARGDIIKAAGAEEERHHPVDDRAVEPGGPLLGEFGGARGPMIHQEHGGALVGAAESVRDPQRDPILAVDAGHAQEQVIARDGGSTRCSAGTGSDGSREISVARRTNHDRGRERRRNMNLAPWPRSYHIAFVEDETSRLPLRMRWRAHLHRHDLQAR
jgi:hypothetical protein